MLRCHCFAHLRGLMLCIIMTTAAAAEDVPAPPVPYAPPSPLAAPAVPPAPVVKFLRSLMSGQTRPSAVFLRDDIAYFPPGPEFRAPNDVPPTPPAPHAPLPVIPETRGHRGCSLLGSDAFAGGPVDEALPECHPLPCLVEARWRNEPVTPEFAAASPSAPAASECSPGICFPNADKLGYGPACLDVQFLPVGPAPVRTARHTPPRPPVPHVVRVAAAAPESPQPLTRVQHLQEAADHLEAAGHPDEAQHLRERAADMQRHARQRLQELREHKQQIEEEIQELERISGRVDQVQIRVSMLEVDEKKLKELGITFETSDGSQFPLTAAHDAPQFKLLSGTRAAAQLHALRKSGAVKVLAEPTVVTTIGRPASVRSGGEVPIPIPQPDGTATLHFEEIGVTLETFPLMLDDGRLRLYVSTEVAERDDRSAERVEGAMVPGTKRRRFDVQAEMRFDQTLVIRGLSEVKQPVVGHPHPILNKIPHQDRLFKQVSDTAVEESSPRSLVVFVTVEPVPAASSIPGR